MINVGIKENRNGDKCGISKGYFKSFEYLANTRN